MDVADRLRRRISQKSPLDRDRETMELALAEIERLRAALATAKRAD